MSYRVWIKPDNGDWLIVESRNWPVAGSALNDVEPSIRTFAPCEVLVVHTRTREVVQYLLRRYHRARQSPQVAIGCTGTTATYAEPDGTIKLGVDWTTCPGVKGCSPITSEDLKKQAEEALDAIALPNANGRVYPPSLLKRAFQAPLQQVRLEHHDALPPVKRWKIKDAGLYHPDDIDTADNNELVEGNYPDACRFCGCSLMGRSMIPAQPDVCTQCYRREYFAKGKKLNKTYEDQRVIDPLAERDYHPSED